VARVPGRGFCAAFVDVHGASSFSPPSWGTLTGVLATEPPNCCPRRRSVKSTTSWSRRRSAFRFDDPDAPLSLLHLAIASRSIFRPGCSVLRVIPRIWGGSATIASRINEPASAQNPWIGESEQFCSDALRIARYDDPSTRIVPRVLAWKGERHGSAINSARGVP
jgi:hypothetical protein